MTDKVQSNGNQTYADPFQDEYPSDSISNAEGSGDLENAPIDIAAKKAEILQELRNSDLNGSQRQEVLNRLKSLEQGSGETIDPDQALLTIAAYVKGERDSMDVSAGDEGDLGSLDIDGDGEPDFNPDDFGSDSDNYEKQIPEYEKKIEENKNLTAEEKQDYLDQLAKIKEEFAAKPEDPTSIEDRFLQLKQEIEGTTSYPSSIARLAEKTGKGPEEIEKLMKKYGLDPMKLPRPNDPRISRLINDPNFSDQIKELSAAEKAAFKTAKKAGKTHEHAAEGVNRAVKGTNSSNAKPNDDTPFIGLYNLYTRQGTDAEALHQARVDSATAKMDILAAMYSAEALGDIEILEAKESGLVKCKFGTLNLSLDASGKPAKINSKDLDWPEVKLVSISIDNEGEGRSYSIAWMKEAHYPWRNIDPFDTLGYNKGSFWRYTDYTDDGVIIDIGEQ